MHGASVVRAKEVVYRKLLSLQEKAVAVLGDILEFGDDKVRIQAVQAVLDRTGLEASVQVKTTAAEDYAALTNEELEQRYQKDIELLRRLKSLPTSSTLRMHKGNVNSQGGDSTTH